MNQKTKRPMQDSHPPQPAEKGFTLVELLIVVAIIGLLASVAIPGLQRALLRARAGRLAKDSITLYNAFLRYNIDNSLYPSTNTPKERAFNKSTLDPLRSGDYLKSTVGILSNLQGNKITSYDSPNIGGPDTEFWAVLTLADYSSVKVVIGDTENFPGFEGTPIQGGYFILGEQLLPLDENIIAHLTQ